MAFYHDLFLHVASVPQVAGHPWLSAPVSGGELTKPNKGSEEVGLCRLAGVAEMSKQGPVLVRCLSAGYLVHRGYRAIAPSPGF